MQQFVQLRDRYSPDLARAFIAGLQIGENGILYCSVARKDFIIQPEDWQNVIGLAYEGQQILDPQTVENYSRKGAIECFISGLMLERLERKPKVGLLSIEGRLLHYVVVTILNPKLSNTSVMLEEDLFLMFCLKYNVKMNWAWYISKKWLSGKNKPRRPIQNANLIQAFLDYFDIDANASYMPVTRRFGRSTLAKMSIKKINKVWYHDGTPVNPPQYSPNELNEEMDRAAQAYASHSTQPSHPVNTSIPSFSNDPFQCFVASSLNCMETWIDTISTQMNSRFTNLEGYMKTEFTSMDVRYQGLSADVEALTGRVRRLQCQFNDEENGDDDEF